jgi:DNA-binding GntR family transcriptional regulator
VATRTAKPQPLRTLSRPVPLGQMAYDRIRRGLAAGGELDGLDRLIEQDLAARLTMSRTPVRDALHRLALMGFLEPSAGGGYVRRSFSLRDAREHYELRVLLEPVAADLAATGVLSGGRAKASGRTRDGWAKDPDEDERFHLLVAQRSGNDVLARVIASVVERLVGFGISEVNADNRRDIRVAHRRIADAIERREPGAGAEMEEHLAECQHALLARLAATWPSDDAGKPAGLIREEARRA